MQINPRAYQAFLFDMDGTILTSIEAAERVWGRWALEQGLDLATFLPTIHGARAVDTIRRLNLPGVDPQVEAERITLGEIADTEGVKAIAGAAEFLGALPPERWAIVTSAPRELALRRLGAAGLPPPGVFITADDVSQGKPDPSGYRMAARALGFSPADCLIFEDAQVGILAAEAARSDVLVITAAHPGGVATTHPQCQDYRDLALESTADGQLLLRRR